MTIGVDPGSYIGNVDWRPPRERRLKTTQIVTFREKSTTILYIILFTNNPTNYRIHIFITIIDRQN